MKLNYPRILGLLAYLSIVGCGLWWSVSELVEVLR